MRDIWSEKMMVFFRGVWVRVLFFREDVRGSRFFGRIFDRFRSFFFFLF